jgi:hypothetical protein
MQEPVGVLSSNIFLNNSAIYGKRVATEAWAIIMKDVITVDLYGVPISPFIVSLVDYYQEPVRTDSSSLVSFTLQSSSNPSCFNGVAYMTGGLIEDYTAGLAVVNQLEAHCSPGEFLNALATTSLSETDSDLIK